MSPVRVYGDHQLDHPPLSPADNAAYIDFVARADEDDVLVDWVYVSALDLGADPSVTPGG